MLKVRRSAIVLSAAAIVIGSAAFTLAHTHQSLEVSKNIIQPNRIVSNSSTSAAVSSLNSENKSNSAVGTNMKEPVENNKPKAVPPTADDFTLLKSKFGLLNIPTYDGSNQLTHPKVLYFPNGWHGYRYWMSMTPYPHSRDRYENPSIVVSNDGEKWVTPTGLKNPVSGVPNDVGYGGHYSDPHLVMHGDVMELWYRHNPGNKKTKAAINTINIYYKQTSRDGIHWSNAVELLNASDGHLSMAVNYEDGMYKAWYATYKGQLCYAQSKDSFSWSAPAVASIELPAGYQPYHQDVIKVGSTYCLLQCAMKPVGYTFAEFFATSSDGIHFSNVKRIYPTHDSSMWNNICFYRSTLFEKNGKIEMYLTLWLKGINGSWYLTHRTYSLQDLLSPNSENSIVSSSEPPKPPVDLDGFSSEAPKPPVTTGESPSEAPKPPVTTGESSSKAPESPNSEAAAQL